MKRKRIFSRAGSLAQSRLGRLFVGAATVVVCVLPIAACGDDDSGTAADALLVGAACMTDEDCERDEEEGAVAKRCLLQFKGGYCGIEGCETNEECPSGSACVAHDDGNTYCFRICANKPECNLHRSPDDESNCSSSVTFTEPTSAKACVPPSG